MGLTDWLAGWFSRRNRATHQGCLGKAASSLIISPSASAEAGVDATTGRSSEEGEKSVKRTAGYRLEHAP